MSGPPVDHARTGGVLRSGLDVDVRQCDRDDQKPDPNPNAHVEQDALSPSARMEYAAFLTKDAAEAGAPRLHQNQNNQAHGKDQFGDS